MPLNTTVNDPLLPRSTEKLSQGAPAADTTFELHNRNRFIINSMINFLKGVRDPYIGEHTFFLLRSTLLSMIQVSTAAVYLQENEDEGPPIFFWLLDMASNIRRTSDGSRCEANLPTVFKGLAEAFNPDYKYELSALHKYPYSWFKHC